MLDFRASAGQHPGRTSCSRIATRPRLKRGRTLAAGCRVSPVSRRRSGEPGLHPRRTSPSVCAKTRTRSSKPTPGRLSVPPFPAMPPTPHSPDERLSSAGRRADVLREGAGASPSPQAERAVEELSIAHGELEVTEEALRVQNERRALAEHELAGERERYRQLL